MSADQEAGAEDFINNTLAVKRVDELKQILTDILPIDLYGTPSTSEERNENLHISQFAKIVELLFFYSTQSVDQTNDLFLQLSEYQEYSFLLDPHWEQLVVPAIDILREQVKKQCNNASSNDNKQMNIDRLDRLTSLIYECIKCRGYKTIGV